MKAATVEEYRIVSNYQTVRKTLLEDKFADRLERPLAYWALPNDRRLPLAFLGRTLKDLLDTPFEELSATPGIGQKKINSLVKLLSRATKDTPPNVPLGIDSPSESKKSAVVEKPRRNGTKFDPSVVSEALWTQWRESVVKHGVAELKLGRLAPTLQALPTVIWQTSLNKYVNLGVGEIRQLKTHGEKRVRVVLEVFCIVHETLSQESDIPAAELLAPKFIAPIEATIARWLEQPSAPGEEEVRDALTLPLLEQLNVDAGPTIHALSQGRLGIDAEPQSVRQQSRKMGVTRARVYQLLEDCAKVMQVRWPDGADLLQALLAKCQSAGADAATLRLLRATNELFYPSKKGLSDEPMQSEAPALATQTASSGDQGQLAVPQVSAGPQAHSAEPWASPRETATYSAASNA